MGKRAVRIRLVLQQGEHCYIIEGSARIEAPYGQVEIRKGDYVVFPVGLKCRWKISERIKKHYEFR